MLKENNVPKLRFKDFEDEWKYNLAKDLCEFSKGKGFSKNDLVKDGKPILLYGSMYTNFKNTLSSVKTFVNNIKIEACYSKRGDVVVPSSGETRDDIARATNIDANNIILGGDLNILHPNNELNSSFLSLSITYGKGHKRLSRLAQGNSVVHLYNSDLRTLVIVYPSVYEQQKIGSFFEKIDKIIELQTKKLEQLKKLKQGYLQKMFPEDGKLLPRLRFSGFSEEWKEDKLGNVYNINTGRSVYNSSNHGKYPIAGSTGVIGYDNEFDYDGNFLLVARVGDAGSTYCNSGKMKITDNTIFIEAEYENFLSGVLKNKNIKKFSVGSGRKLIKSSDLKKINVVLPEKREQLKIDIFLIELNSMIDVQDEKISNLKQQKKAYLQKMFI
ncbi:restriction endonuclease subunit S [Apilactobacillus kunkeei]|uniref:Type I restriction modification DNA specificity domain-containing protein n=1 Tax=Apilactobacillus kunkeei TaxID=148814 RepID=A0A0P7K997_9LACO|nr:restriction endonuclease subunit S [Apilactobacillus kunkeei]KPN83470.1 hypothetical protein RZ78_09380 [Apilactobacillus kunkeei]